MPTLELLLQSHPSAWSTRSNNGRTPLHTAALAGRSDALHFLLANCCSDYGANDERLRDSCGATPLMEAIRGGHAALIPAFLEHPGHHLETADGFGRNALHVAAHSGQAGIVRDLVACRGQDPNGPSGHLDMRAIHWAALEGQAEAIGALLENGADVNALDAKGRTALDIARQSRHPKVAAALLEQQQ